MCIPCWFTRVGMNVFALLVYKSVGECVYLVGSPELG